jgi:hypothetical protein
VLRDNKKELFQYKTKVAHLEKFFLQYFIGASEANVTQITN